MERKQRRGITSDGQVIVDKDAIIVFANADLATKTWRGGKYLFVPSAGDIFLPVFEPKDVLRWEIDRPRSLVYDWMLFSVGEWFKQVRAEFGDLGACVFILRLQVEAQQFYEHIAETNRRLKNGEHAVSRVVQKGD